MILLYVCLSFIVGNCALLVANYFPLSILLISIVVCLGLVFCLKIKTIPIVVSFLIGLFYADLRQIPTTPIEELSGKKLTLTVCIEDTVDKTFLRNVEVISAYDTKSGSKVHLEKVNLVLKQTVEPYSVYEVTGNISRDIPFNNPSSLTGQTVNLYIEQIDAVKPLKKGFINRIRDDINSYITNNFEPQSSGFLKAILTGHRDGIDKPMRDAFNKTGLAHILSISGAHFGLFVFMVFKFMNLLLRLLPEGLLVRLTLHITLKQVSAILTMPFITFYLLISSMSYPSIRAFIMIM
ncbi:MAG: ComEC/Rec2 family competence protein, partial [Thermodesulfovibrionales bacterium]|nr:ComEC/Rec2 family competence protein [Thermodesulfovibrionales bacterium]